MKTRPVRRESGGFTLAEISIAMAVLSIVGGLAYSMLTSSTTLFAKNVSLNTTNTTLRTALDRIYKDVNQAYGIPKLINADGTPATTSAAAGITLDVYLGGPYMVTNPGGTGLVAGTSSFSMKHYTADALTAQPLSTAYDVVVLDNGVTRPVVRSIDTPSPSSTSGNVRTITVNLASPLGSAVTWNATTTKTAFLVRKKAYIVATVNGRAELRLYNNAEAATDYSSGYTILATGLSGQTTNNENTPFSIVTESGSACVDCTYPFLKIAMRMENPEFNNYLGQTGTLAAKQAKEFNTFLRVDTRLRPRNAF